MNNTNIIPDSFMDMICELKDIMTAYVKSERKKDVSWSDIYFDLTRCILDIFYDIELDEMYDEICEEKEMTKEEKNDWVPVGVRPPKDFESVYVQDRLGSHIISKYIPPRIKPKNHPDGYWGDTDYVDHDYFDMVAWHPLPKSYTERLEK